MQKTLRYMVFSFFGAASLVVPLAFASAQASPSVSIQALSPGNTVTPGNEVSFSVVTTGLNNPTYSVSDSIGSSVSNADINSSGVFTWVPSTSDSGTHNLTVTANDGINSSNASVQIIVNGPPSVSISSLSPGTSVSVGNTLSFAGVASNFSSTPSYSVSDSFSGSSLNSGDINSTSGNFNWTPVAQDTGTHSITVYASDSSGDSANAVESITVNPLASLSILSLSPGTTTVFGSPVNFSVSASGFSNPVFSVGDSFGGTSVSNGNINSSGAFNWTPGVGDVGTHNITVFVSDSSGHSANIIQQIIVQSAGLTIGSLNPGTVITAGSTLSFTASAPGFINPSYSLSDSFGGTSVTSNNINPSTGIFTWTPDANQTGLHNLVLYAVDSYGHTANTQVSITVNPEGVSSTVPVSPTATQTGVSYTFTASLVQGSTGPDVTALQTILNQEGYLAVAPTGYYGALTAAAVEQFQAAHGIEQLGIVGPATRTALNELSSSSTTTAAPTTGSRYVFNNFLGIGSTGADVTALQQTLQADGYLSLSPTGYFGSLTQAAVEEFQGAHGIEQVGYVGPATRAALNQ